MFQYHIYKGEYPHQGFYSISGYYYKTRGDAIQAARAHMKAKGIDPDKMSIKTNDERYWDKLAKKRSKVAIRRDKKMHQNEAQSSVAA